MCLIRVVLPTDVYKYLSDVNNTREMYTIFPLASSHILLVISRSIFKCTELIIIMLRYTACISQQECLLVLNKGSS